MLKDSFLTKASIKNLSRISMVFFAILYDFPRKQILNGHQYAHNP